MLLGVIALAVLLISLPIFRAATPHWPAIVDSAKVRHDASRLCREFQGEIPRSAWPGSIIALHPRLLSTDQKSVDVMLSAGGISAKPWGYVIWPDTIARNDNGIERYDAARRQ